MDLDDETDLFCSICKYHFDISVHLPRMIPDCGHTYCNECILKSLESTHQIICPEDEVVSIRKDITNFPKNFALIRILEKKKKEGQFGVMTSLPSQSDSLSQKSSVKGQRTSLASNISHARLKTEESSNQDCYTHNKQRDIVCLNCKEQICTNCALFGSHKKHDVLSLDDAKEKIQCQALKLLKITEEVHSKIDFLQNGCLLEAVQKALREYYTRVLNEVSEQFESVVQEIKNVQKSIENQLRNGQDQQLKSLNFAVNISQTQSQQFLNYFNSAQDELKKLKEKCMKREIFLDLLNENSAIILKGLDISNALDVQKSEIIDKISLAFAKCSKVIWHKDINGLLKQLGVVSKDEESSLAQQQNQNFLQNNKMIINLIQDKEDDNASQLLSQQNSMFDEILKEVQSFYSKSNINHYFKFETPNSSTSKIISSRPSIQYHNSPNYSQAQLISEEKQNTSSTLEQKKIEVAIENVINLNKVMLEQQPIQNQISKFEDPKRASSKQNSNRNSSKKEDHINSSLLEDIDIDNIPEYMKESLLINQSIANNSIIGEDLKLLMQKEEKYGATILHQEPQIILEAKRVESEEEESEAEESDNENCNSPDNFPSEINNKDELLSNIFSINGNMLDETNLLEESTRFQDDGMDQSWRHNNQSLIQNFQPEFFKLIQEIMKNQIESADFSSMEIMDRGLEAVTYAIQDNTSLKLINFERNKITSDGFKKLIEGLKSSSFNLETINLNNNLITDMAFHSFLTLKGNTNRKLSHVYIQNNLINFHIASNLIKTIKEEMNITIHI